MTCQQARVVPVVTIGPHKTCATNLLSVPPNHLSVVTCVHAETTHHAIVGVCNFVVPHLDTANFIPPPLRKQTCKILAISVVPSVNHDALLVIDP